MLTNRFLFVSFKVYCVLRILMMHYHSYIGMAMFGRPFCYLSVHCLSTDMWDVKGSPLEFYNGKQYCQLDYIE